MKIGKMTLRTACAFISLLVFSCSAPRMDTFEKNRDISGQEWHVKDLPSFEVEISAADTAFQYNMYVNVRHTDAYPYSNLWLIIHTYAPGDSTADVRRVELPLQDTDGKWLGNGLDDIFEHRIPIQQNAIFSRPGKYRFTFEQNMRQDPLTDIMSVGLRIEKAAPRK